MSDREIIADYEQHTVGDREVVDWTRLDGVTYRDVPVVYLRQVSREDYRRDHPLALLTADRVFFWEVSID